MKVIGEIYLIRCFRLWPALLFTLVMIQSCIYYLNDGPAWYELGNLFQDCKQYWWTPLLFVNDIIPYYTKDLRGCMRYTAVFSIEMKYFLLMPLIVQFYHLGYKKTAVSLCSGLIVIGLCLNLFFFEHNEINPGYTNMLDYEAFDIFTLKPWTHIESYFFGILIAF